MTFDLCWDCPISARVAAYIVFGGTSLAALSVALWRFPPGLARFLALVVAAGAALTYILGTHSILRYHVDWRPDLQYRVADFGVLIIWYAITAGVICAGRKWRRA